MADMLQFESTDENRQQQNADQTEKQPQSAAARRYSSDEVADIIRFSLLDESSRPEEAVDHDELLSIGKEFGVDDAQIDRAIRSLEEERRTKDKEQHLWQKFKAHCMTSVAVMVLCVFINIFTGMAVFWAGYVVLGMGLFLLGHYAGIRYAPEFVEMAYERSRGLARNYYEDQYVDDVNVAFNVCDSSGLLESDGLISFADDTLKIEYQTSDSVLGVFKTSVKEIEIALGDIRQARMERKMFGSELVLQGSSLRIFRNLPGSKGGNLRIKISRQSQLAAQNLVDAITVAKA
ncbi:MAG: 2TM domain-containing protein [Gammaproteobacteria bacterium]|nr:2TM domain-containing protein [Gammaproteobacteria bacterium]